MSEKEKRVALATLNIGQGNLLSLAGAQRASQEKGLKTPSLLIKNPLTLAASLKQWRVTHNEDSRESYNRKYDQTRNGLPARLLGLLSLFQLIIFLQKVKPQKLILTQELPIAALNNFELPIASAILNQLDEILILATDVFAKNGAVLTAQKQQHLRNIKIITWNNQSFQALRAQNVNAALVAPWLLPETEAFPKNKSLAPMAIVRPSGAGINKSYLEAILQFITAQNPNIFDYQIFRHRHMDQYDQKGHRIATRRHHFSSLVDLHLKMAQAFPEILMSYPSEMIQLIAQLYNIGWTGKHFSFPERGLHELENLRMAAELNLSRGLVLDGDQLNFKEGHSDEAKPDLARLREELGRVNLASVI